MSRFDNTFRLSTHGNRNYTSGTCTIAKAFLDIKRNNTVKTSNFSSIISSYCDFAACKNTRFPSVKKVRNLSMNGCL